MRRFLLVSGKENPKIRKIHEWLPNQELHFANVRCIECHTEVKEGLMVSHNIRRKEEAVRNCVECHTENSRLKASLYKYQNLQQRSEDGTLSVIISNDSYVIGTQQIPFLRTLSFIILGLVFAGIIVSLNYLLFIIGNAVTGNGKYYIVKFKNFLKRPMKQAYYYAWGMFHGMKPPYPLSENRKFNPLQKYSYLLVMYLFVPVVIISGFGLLFPEIIIEEK
jgi:hypothetical protein